MEQAGSGAESLGGVAGVEGGCVERFAGLQRISEVEGVKAAGDAHLPVGRLLDGDAPVSAPAEGAEPDAAVVFAGIARVDGEPGVDVVAGVALTAFENHHALVNRLV